MSLYPAKLTGIDILQTRIDYANSSTQYVGYAPPNAKTSEAKWQISRLTFDAQGRVTQKEFAGLDSKSFNQVWDNRASLTYSAS